MQIAEIIRLNMIRLMGEARLTQVGLAERAGLKQPVISRAVNGEMANPELKTLQAIAAGLGCQLWELVRPEGAEDAADRKRRQADDKLAEMIENLRAELAARPSAAIPPADLAKLEALAKGSPRDFRNVMEAAVEPLLQDLAERIPSELGKTPKKERD